MDDSLLRELFEKGIKHNPETIVALARDPSGRVIFLEQGNDKVGLQHIINRHGNQFEGQGIPTEQIPDAIMTAVIRGTPVGVQGKSRTIYEVEFNGLLRRIAVSVAENGFIVGANPVTRRTGG